MKAVALPSPRFDPELRQAAESALHEDESLTSFLEQAWRNEVGRRRMQTGVIARGLAAREEAGRTSVYYKADRIMGSLRHILVAAKSKTRP